MKTTGAVRANQIGAHLRLFELLAKPSKRGVPALTNLELRAVRRVFPDLARDEAPDGEAVSESHALFQAALEHSGDPVRAWKVTLTALLQDVEIAYY